MSERLKTVSLRQFRERAAEIHEPVDVAIRDRDGNLNIIGYFTPYATYPADSTPLAPLEAGPGEEGSVTLDYSDVAPTSGRVIRTPADAAAAAPQVHPFPKSAQTGKRREK